jgi:hypothetical protein
MTAASRVSAIAVSTRQAADPDSTASPLASRGQQGARDQDELGLAHAGAASG